MGHEVVREVKKGTITRGVDEFVRHVVLGSSLYTRAPAPVFGVVGWCKGPLQKQQQFSPTLSRFSSNCGWQFSARGAFQTSLWQLVAPVEVYVCFASGAVDILHG